MSNRVFINEVFENSISKYIICSKSSTCRETNDFDVIVIRLLMIIYGDIDFLNPFITKDSKTVYFNMCKYGYDNENVEAFFNELVLYDEFENKQNNENEKNPYFVSIQKKLIDMFKIKKSIISVDSLEEKKFYKLLYTPYSESSLQVSENYLKSSDVLEIDKYYKKELESKEVKKEVISTYLPEFLDDDFGEIFETPKLQHNSGYTNLFIIGLIALIVFGISIVNLIVR